MYSRIFISSLLLSLLPGCIATNGLSATEQVSALRYTNHRPAATVEETIPLHIAGPFGLGDRMRRQGHSRDRRRQAWVGGESAQLA